MISIKGTHGSDVQHEEHELAGIGASNGEAIQFGTVARGEVVAKDEPGACNCLRFAMGHYIYESHVDVIAKFPTSRLAELIGQESCAKSDYVPIERSGRHFGTILDYMRDQSSFVASRFNMVALEEIRVEAEYYRLDGLAEMCRKQAESMTPFGNWLAIIPGDNKDLFKNLRRPVVVVDFRTVQVVAKHLVEMANFVQAFDYGRYDVLALKSRKRFDYGLDNCFAMQLYEPCDEQDYQILRPKKPSIELVDNITGLVDFRTLLMKFIVKVDIHLRSKYPRAPISNNVPYEADKKVELKKADRPWKPELEAESEMDDARLLKVFRGYLNKLTEQKFDRLIGKIAALDLNNGTRLNRVVDLVFNKATNEHKFCELYARMCMVISNRNFYPLLRRRCYFALQTSYLYLGLDVERRKQDIAKETDGIKMQLMYEKLHEDMRLRLRKHLGAAKLIGEMYKLGLVTPIIIRRCMDHLIGSATNEHLECLCSLTSTVGAKMASERDPTIMYTLNFLQSLADSKINDVCTGYKLNFMTNKVYLGYKPNSQIKFTGHTLENRVKCKILDTIELSKRGWKQYG